MGVVDQFTKGFQSGWNITGGVMQAHQQRKAARIQNEFTDWLQSDAAMDDTALGIPTPSTADFLAAEADYEAQGKAAQGAGQGQDTSLMTSQNAADFAAKRDDYQQRIREATTRLSPEARESYMTQFDEDVADGFQRYLSGMQNALAAGDNELAMKYLKRAGALVPNGIMYNPVMGEDGQIMVEQHDEITGKNTTVPLDQSHIQQMMYAAGDPERTHELLAKAKEAALARYDAMRTHEREDRRLKDTEQRTEILGKQHDLEIDKFDWQKVEDNRSYALQEKEFNLEQAEFTHKQLKDLYDYTFGTTEDGESGLKDSDVRARVDMVRERMEETIGTTAIDMDPVLEAKLTGNMKDLYANDGSKIPPKQQQDMTLVVQALAAQIIETTRGDATTDEAIQQAVRYAHVAMYPQAYDQRERDNAYHFITSMNGPRSRVPGGEEMPLIQQQSGVIANERAEPATTTAPGGAM